MRLVFDSDRVIVVGMDISSSVELALGGIWIVGGD